MLTLQRQRLAGVWEVQNGLLWLSPILLLVGLLIGLLAALSAAAFLEGRRRTHRVLWSSQLAALAAGVCFSATTGRLFESDWRRGSVVFAAAFIGGATSYHLAPRLKRAARHAPWVFAGAALLGLLSLELVNRFVLYRLYPQWHWAMALLTLWLAPWIVLPILWASGALLRPKSLKTASLLLLLTIGIGVLASLALRPFAHRLAGFDNIRWLLIEQAPLAGPAVQLTGLVAPPPALDADDCRKGFCQDPSVPTPTGPAGVNWRGRDILLITVDALRADHVGAYGYERPTTPNIDRLAAGGVRFDHAYAPTPHTSYSITSLMTGKYMRPLLLQGAGADSDTWAALLRTYGYRTAAFYPPAVFFIDGGRFSGFRARFLDFEYRKVEFLEGDGRVKQFERYLSTISDGKPVFAWVHLFGPHEPYEARAGHAFGSRDVDRYDSEVAASDETTGKLVELFRRVHPNGVVIMTADHGEEFGDHGGRYHGTTVYEEQVRVPLVINAPGLSPATVQQPVQTIDLLPTVLAGLEIPRPPRIRGRDLTGLLAGRTDEEGQGFAFAETETQAMFAEGRLRLICQRQIGACKLYDVLEDPTQSVDATSKWPAKATELRASLRALSASHGRYERSGMRAEGKGWPAAILRAVAGDSDAVNDLIPLLDDADLSIRRKAAELAFELGGDAAAPALRLALARDDDVTVRRWAALALTRMGQGAPLTFELLKAEEESWRRLAALALAEVGDRRGESTLVRWWQDDNSRDYARSRQLLDALGKIRAKDAVWPLLQSLDDVRLRPHIALALEQIGDDSARGALAKALLTERYQGARVALARAIVSLGGEGELIRPLVRFLGVPDPLPGGVGMAVEAGILEYVGGPNGRQLKRLATEGALGAAIRVVVPRGGNRSGCRIIVRASAWPPTDGLVRIGVPTIPFTNYTKGKRITSRKLPEINSSKMVQLRFPVDGKPHELSILAPASLGLAPKRSVDLVVVTARSVKVEGVVVVPLADELPPPAPEPWEGEGTSTQEPAAAEPRADE